MDAAAELGRNPVCKHQIQPEYGDEQADAGRDCRARLARPNSQARTRTGEYGIIFPVQLTTCRTGSLTRLIHTLAICVTLHTFTVYGVNNLEPCYFIHTVLQYTVYSVYAILLKNQNAPRPSELVVSHIQRIDCQPGKNHFTRWPISLVV